MGYYKMEVNECLLVCDKCSEVVFKGIFNKLPVSKCENCGGDEFKLKPLNSVAEKTIDVKKTFSMDEICGKAKISYLGLFNEKR